MLDVESMISPLDNIITFTWEKNVDALRNLSLSANASAIKYALCYKDFDINADYSTESTLPTFRLTPEYWKMKCDNYIKQDEKAKRDTSHNVSPADYEHL